MIDQDCRGNIRKQAGAVTVFAHFYFWDVASNLPAYICRPYFVFVLETDNGQCMGRYGKKGIRCAPTAVRTLTNLEMLPK